MEQIATQQTATVESDFRRRMREGIEAARRGDAPPPGYGEHAATLPEPPATARTREGIAEEWKKLAALEHWDDALADAKLRVTVAKTYGRDVAENGMTELQAWNLKHRIRRAYERRRAEIIAAGALECGLCHGLFTNQHDASRITLTGYCAECDKA